VKRRERASAPGTFTLSIDVEGLWGLFFVRSFVEDPRAAARVLAGREAVPRIATLLEERAMRATFAFVGHLFLQSCGPWKSAPHPDAPRPRYPWYARDWYADDPGGDETSQPLWFARSQALALAAGGHDVAAHGFSHAILDPRHVGADVADAEFNSARHAAKDAGLAPPVSFVFPQNVVGHVDRLRAAGYACFRDGDAGRPGRGGPPGGARRVGSLAAHALAAPPWVGRPSRRADGVVSVPSSYPLISREGLRRAVTRRAKVYRAEKGLELATRRGAVLHLWTHPHAFGDDAALGDLAAVLDTVASRRDRGHIEVLTMAEVADRCP
jgi:peptidoglycan/xylan/chitin deacetylase (PgdA/CDA1 family)